MENTKRLSSSFCPKKKNTAFLLQPTNCAWSSAGWLCLKLIFTSIDRVLAQNDLQNDAARKVMKKSNCKALSGFLESWPVKHCVFPVRVCPSNHDIDPSVRLCKLGLPKNSLWILETLKLKETLPRMLLVTLDIVPFLEQDGAHEPKCKHVLENKHPSFVGHSCRTHFFGNLCGTLSCTLARHLV